jgi:hypothetical protein
MTRAGTLIAVASLLMVAAISDVVLAQSAPATGSFKGTYSGDVADGGSAQPVRTTTQGSYSNEPAKPSQTSPKTSFQDTYTAGNPADAGAPKSKR